MALKIAGRLALVVMVIAGVVLTLRALIGPLRLPVPVNSPLNAAGFFGLAFVTAILVRTSSRGGAAPKWFFAKEERSGSQWWWMGGAVALTICAYWPSIFFYFLSDDFVLMRGASNFSQLVRSVFVTPGGDGFFRPVGLVSYGLNAIWAGSEPALWHAPSVLLHLANTVFVFLLAVRIGSPNLAAFVAAAVFGLHGTHPEAVAWLAGRFDVLSTFFVLGGLLLFLAYEKERKARYLASSLACLVLGLLTKEAAFVFPVLLLILPREKLAPLRERIRALVPFFLAAGAVFMYRWWLLGGIGGYKTDAGTAQFFALRPVGVLKTLGLRLWGTLAFPINWEVQPELYLGLATGLFVACLIWLAVLNPDRSQVLFALSFVLISALPPFQQLLIGADLQKSRLLYLPSAGFALLLAFLFEPALKKTLQAEGVSHDGNPLWRRFLASKRAFQHPGGRTALAVMAILLFNYAALYHNLKIWGEVADISQRTCTQAASGIGNETQQVIVSGLPGTLKGVYFFQWGFPECLEMRSGVPAGVVRMDGSPDGLQPGTTPVWLSWDSLTLTLHNENREPASGVSRIN